MVTKFCDTKWQHQGPAGFIIHMVDFMMHENLIFKHFLNNHFDTIGKISTVALLCTETYRYFKIANIWKCLIVFLKQIYLA